MNDLLKKLNVLIKAGMNDVLDDAQRAASAPRRAIPQSRLGREIDNEVDQLRQQINSALDYENTLHKRIQSIQTEIDELDQQADAEVARGNDAQARYLIERMQRAKQRQEMAEADLKEHQLATQELIQRVNELDATISEARHAETRDSGGGEQPEETEDRSEALEAARELSQRSGKVLADVLREARETITKMDDMIESTQEVNEAVNTSAADEAAGEVAKSNIEDDLAARRSRLSGPPRKRPPQSRQD